MSLNSFSECFPVSNLPKAHFPGLSMVPSTRSQLRSLVSDVMLLSCCSSMWIGRPQQLVLPRYLDVQTMRSALCTARYTTPSPMITAVASWPCTRLSPWKRWGPKGAHTSLTKRKTAIQAWKCGLTWRLRIQKSRNNLVPPKELPAALSASCLAAEWRTRAHREQ